METIFEDSSRTTEETQVLLDLADALVGCWTVLPEESRGRILRRLEALVQCRTGEHRQDPMLLTTEHIIYLNTHGQGWTPNSAPAPNTRRVPIAKPKLQPRPYSAKRT